MVVISRLFEIIKFSSSNAIVDVQPSLKRIITEHKMKRSKCGKVLLGKSRWFALLLGSTSAASRRRNRLIVLNSIV